MADRRFEKVLWLTRWPPHKPLRGGAIDYSRHLVRALSDLIHVEVLAFRRASVDPIDAASLTWRLVPSSPPRSARSVLSTLPNVAFRHAADRSAKDYVDQILDSARTADAIVVDFIAMFWIMPHLQPLRERLPVVVLNHNHEAALRRLMAAKSGTPHLAALLALDAWKAGRLETSANRSADGFVALTEADRGAIAGLAGTPGVVVMPGYTGPVVEERRIGLDARRVCILGGHAAPHKKMVLRKVLDAIEAADLPPNLVIDVVGDGEATPHARNPRFNFMGYVDDIDAYFQTVSLGILPDVIGGGFKLRALDHVFRRVPMLAARTALDGMGLRPGLDYFEADGLPALAAAIPAILADLPALNATQESAFANYAGRFEWAARARDLHAFLRDLPRSAASPRSGSLAA